MGKKSDVQKYAEECFRMGSTNGDSDPKLERGGPAEREDSDLNTTLTQEYEKKEIRKINRA